jgi:hypothetical protein
MKKIIVTAGLTLISIFGISRISLANEIDPAHVHSVTLDCGWVYTHLDGDHWKSAHDEKDGGPYEYTETHHDESTIHLDHNGVDVIMDFHHNEVTYTDHEHCPHGCHYKITHVD